MNKVTQSIYKKKVDNLEQSGSGSNLNNIVDSNGNLRFIEGNGTAYTEDVVGMTASSTKWVLNGNDLILELARSFTQDVNGQPTIATFELPEWILNKITPLNNGELQIITPLSFNISSTTNYTNVNVTLLKLGNLLAFSLMDDISLSSFNGNPVFFRFTSHLIIDSNNN